MMKLRFSFFIMLITQTTLWAGWHDRKAEGWAWYEKRKLPKEEKTQMSDCLTSTQKMDQVRKQIEEKLAMALLNPTEENIKNYMEEQQKWIERSSHFAQIWAKTLLNHPHLDYTATHMPISQYGLQAYKEEQQEEKQRLIESLANRYGLFFFYAGKSEISIVFASIVGEFAKKYGFNVMAISIDGEEIAGMESKLNNGIAETLGIDIVPALYLINPKENIAVPVAYGLVAMDQIENNIFLQFKERPHE